MRRSLRFIAALCAIVAFGSATGLRAQFVHAQGRQIVDGRGQPLHLRGINLGNWMVPEGYMWKFDGKPGGPASPREIEAYVREMIGPGRAAEFWKAWRDTYYTRADMHRIREAGFDSVRVPLHWKLLQTDDAEGFALLDRLVGWCHEEGLLVVLDLHAAPGGANGANIDDGDGWPWLYNDAAAQQQTVALWTRIARRYRGNPTVIGYDLLNEPLPSYPAVRPMDAKLEPLYRRLTAAIRTVDPDHAILLEGPKWDTEFGVFGKPFDSNLIYEFHTYWSKPEQATIQQYLDFRERWNVPIWLGESGENTDAWVAQFARLVEADDIGWAFWPYKKMDATSAVVSYARPAHWDEIVQYANGDRGMSHLEDRVKTRPAQATIDAAFAELLHNIQFAQEQVQPGFVHALLPASALGR